MINVNPSYMGVPDTVYMSRVDYVTSLHCVLAKTAIIT